MLASSVDRDVNGGSRRLKLTPSVISDVKPTIYILHFNYFGLRGPGICLLVALVQEILGFRKDSLPEMLK